MNSYEAKQEARRERYEARAEKARQDAAAAMQRSSEGLPPWGEPIKIGHHSERGHRAALKRSHAAMDRAITENTKAAHYEAKAAGVGNGGVSSDDPEALLKLQHKLADRERAQAMMKDANKLIRAAFKQGCRGDTDSDNSKMAAYLEKMQNLGLLEFEARKRLEPDFAGRRGFADYETSNNSAEIRRLKQRLEQLQAAQGAETTEAEYQGFGRVVENAEENRLQIFFDGKPSAEIRAELKSQGFRWAPSVGAWQRHLNNGARFALQIVLKRLEITD